MIVKNLYYDYYNRRWCKKSWGGTLTGNAPGTVCGTFFVVVKDKRNDKNKTGNQKRLD